MASNRKDTSTQEWTSQGSAPVPETPGVSGTDRESTSSVFKDVVINGETYQYIEGCGLPPMLSAHLNQQQAQEQQSSGSSSLDAENVETVAIEQERQEEEEEDDDDGDSDTFLDAKEHLDSDLYSDDGFGDDLPDSVLTSTTLWNALPAEDDYMDHLSDFGEDDIASQTSDSKDLQDNFDDALLESIADEEYLSDEITSSQVHDSSTAPTGDFGIELDEDPSVVELIEAAFADDEFLEDTPTKVTDQNQKDVIVIDADDNTAPGPSSVVLGKRKAEPEPLHRQKPVHPSFGEGSQRFPVELDSDDYGEDIDLLAFKEIHESAPPSHNSTSKTELQQVIEVPSSGESAAASSSSTSQDRLTNIERLYRYRQQRKENSTRPESTMSQPMSRQGSEISLGRTPSQSQDLPDQSGGMIWGTGSLSPEIAPQNAPLGYTSDASSRYSDEDPPPPYEVEDEEDDPLRPRMTPPDPTKTAEGLTLSPDQLFVLDQVVTHNRSVFFTGSAGTGKSVLLRELIVRLRQKYSRWAPPGRNYWDSTAAEKVAVTASTGIAACNIGGCTLHSFAGIGLGNEQEDVLIRKVYSSRKTVGRWRKACVLIVDEVSMVDAVLLDKLEAIARSVRKRPMEAWGGLQVVLTGDFFQLPPVDKSGKARFCFEAASWKSSIHVTIQLEQVFRQKDQTFADMLNEVRIGQMQHSTIERFQILTRPLPEADGLKPTDLFPLRRQVEEANGAELRALTSESLFFVARDSGPQKEKLEQQCVAPTKLELKVGAQVMLLRNQNGGIGGLVNGSIGIVVEYTRRPADNVRLGSDDKPLPSLNSYGELLPRIRFMLEGGRSSEMVVGREEWSMELPDGEVVARRVQIPLCLAWSLSIHKAQGQTLTKVRVDLAKVFEKGQAYVALSRATSLEGLQVLNFHPQKVMVHPKVVTFYENLCREKERALASQSQANGDQASAASSSRRS
ncbi:ATP-dependent DNA helicase PIF1 [Entomortierella parvispora]|uniref:ATP-dependent DNA helicase PIF1 n=1 Tax=Entomortierella parvispora TaxID=205924 RepID=A0A9P3HK44_9FUNG|nr:ATP-dependent DNA helicase PIF1 [Entomortierella parvispora]